MCGATATAAPNTQTEVGLPDGRVVMNCIISRAYTQWIGQLEGAPGPASRGQALHNGHPHRQSLRKQDDQLEMMGA